MIRTILYLTVTTFGIAGFVTAEAYPLVSVMCIFIGVSAMAIALHPMSESRN